jgi:hypothetical protein
MGGDRKFGIFEGDKVSLKVCYRQKVFHGTNELWVVSKHNPTRKFAADGFRTLDRQFRWNGNALKVFIWVQVFGELQILARSKLLLLFRQTVHKRRGFAKQ